ncbi:MAG: AraC family transcriptional regulator [Mucilaginibacter sp.]|nr:AraC family transcriptional regulator [Mucilaginibacter sp.]
MEEIIKIDSIIQYNTMRGVRTSHPLVTLIDLSETQPMPARSFYFGLYVIGLKEINNAQLRYGRSHYDYQEGSLIFVAPGQVVGVEPGDEPYDTKGWALLFHPDLLKGSSMAKHMHNYSFFSYDVNDALHLSDNEKKIVIDILFKMRHELDQNIDKHSKMLIVSNIELLLNYCIRFYDRQFITREHVNKGILERFEYLVNDYFSSGKAQHEGLPSVAYCAGTLNLSANYFGDLIKKETGRSAQEYIQAKLIDVAKEKVFDKNKSVSEIAYELGFKYPQHFMRLFKQKTGVSPNKYRIMN